MKIDREKYINTICLNKANLLIEKAKKIGKIILPFLENIQDSTPDSIRLEQDYLKHMYKTPKSLSRKLVSRLKKQIWHKNLNTKQQLRKELNLIASDIGDYLRFTFIIASNIYVKKTIFIHNEIIKRFNAKIFKPKKNEVRWDLGDGYQGSQTVYLIKGIPVEIQYHTTASFTAKKTQLHPLYEIKRKNCDIFFSDNFCSTLDDELILAEKNIPIPIHMNCKTGKINDMLQPCHRIKTKKSKTKKSKTKKSKTKKSGKSKTKQKK